jgi:hypothetical protein
VYGTVSGMPLKSPAPASPHYKTISVWRATFPKITDMTQPISDQSVSQCSIPESSREREFRAGLGFGDDADLHVEKGVALVEKVSLVVGRLRDLGTGESFSRGIRWLSAYFGFSDYRWLASGIFLV